MKSFLDLPPEIRVMIYDLLLSSYMIRPDAADCDFFWDNYETLDVGPPTSPQRSKEWHNCDIEAERHPLLQSRSKQSVSAFGDAHRVSQADATSFFALVSLHHTIYQEAGPLFEQRCHK